MATPNTSTAHYPDDYLERWGRVFVQHRLDLTLGLTFEKFLRVPQYFMNKYHEVMNSEDHKKAVEAAINGREFALLEEKQAAIRECVYSQSIKDAIFRSAHGISTPDDADLLERAIRAARGIVNVPRQNNGHPIEKMVHHRHPRSQSDFTYRQEVKS